MLTDPSKGGSSLSQAFMQSGAPQQKSPLPTITQPQQQSLPQIAQPATPKPQQQAPVMGSFAPQQPQGNWVRSSDYIIDQGGSPFRWVPDKNAQAPIQQPVQTKFPSQSQLLARAINERAQRGG